MLNYSAVSAFSRFSETLEGCELRDDSDSDLFIMEANIGGNSKTLKVIG